MILPCDPFYFGGLRPGDFNHLFRCAAASIWLSFRNNSSRSLPGRNLRACASNLAAASARRSSNKCGFERFRFINAAHLARVADLILKYALEFCLSGTLHSEIKASLVRYGSYYAPLSDNQ